MHTVKNVCRLKSGPSLKNIMCQSDLTTSIVPSRVCIFGVLQVQTHIFFLIYMRAIVLVFSILIIKLFNLIIFEVKQFLN